MLTGIRPLREARWTAACYDACTSRHVHWVGAMLGGRLQMAKDKNRTGRETRKPKKAKPAAKPATPGERVPGKIVSQPPPER
jgi:hypothetical protein